ncbi:hypothetical protein FQN53_003080 [Emmonsiellopsis sp. PD_33]|nr:hypothetical protein FQN53_003080 [Emmonsiellopsis sp. PD_33]
MSLVDGKSLQLVGQDEYRRGNFDEALCAFTKACTVGGGDIVGILDNRAATYCKLGRLKPALHDGRAMVSEDKMDARGYLRTAKILQLMEKSENALRIYQHALRTLPQDNPRRQQIKDLAEKLDHRLSGPKTADPFTRLPLELVVMILENLDLKSMLAAIRVSKHWGTILNSLPKLWNHLDLSKAGNRKTVSLKNIQAFLRRSRWGLTRASLVNLYPNDVPKLMPGFKQCRSLEHLEILGNFPRDFAIPPIYTLINLKILNCSDLPPMPHTHFAQVLTHCSKLERIKVSLSLARPDNSTDLFPTNLPNLRSLSIYMPSLRRIWLGPVPTLPFLRDVTLFDVMPGLEEFNLIFPQEEVNATQDVPKISDLPNLKQLGLVGVPLISFPELPESLEHLTLSRSKLHAMTSMASLSDMAPNLQTLNIDRFRYVAIGAFLTAFIASKSSLTRVNLERCHLVPEDLVESMIRGIFKNVTHFNVACLPEIRQSVINTIIHTMPHLKELDISQTQVKEYSARALIDSDLLQIEKLIIHGTEEPFSRDFLDYAKHKGVEIPPPMSGEKYGRRDRAR